MELLRRKGVLRPFSRPRARVHEATTSAQDPTGDGIYEIELRIKHSDGSVRWANAKGKIYFTADTAGENTQRRAIRFTGIVRDVSQFQLQKQAIVEGEERFHRAIHEAPKRRLKRKGRPTKSCRN